MPLSYNPNGAQCFDISNQHTHPELCLVKSLWLYLWLWSEIYINSGNARQAPALPRPGFSHYVFIQMARHSASDGGNWIDLVVTTGQEQRLTLIAESALCSI